MAKKVTPRMRCVSRNQNKVLKDKLEIVTPRMRCVSRNHKSVAVFEVFAVTPRMRCVSRNGKWQPHKTTIFSHTSHEVCE